MKRLFYMMLIPMVVSCGRESGNVAVIPQPLYVKTLPGSIDISCASFWIDPQVCQETVSVVESFMDELSSANRVSMRGKSVLCFDFKAGLQPEAYELYVSRKKVRIRASSFNGFLYAVQTIRQLLQDSAVLPCVHIKDAPRFGYRGLHLDCARHFWRVEQIKKYLDIMAIHKMNRFHWHLTDDQGWRIEIKTYPRLVEVGSIRRGTAIGKGWYNVEYDGIPYEGYYTQAQIREIVSYASSKGIEVIPEIDFPGHMLAAVASYPHLCCTGKQLEVWGRWGTSHDVLCAGKEETYEFLENVLLEVIYLFPSHYIHIGGDECPKSRWKECPCCQAKMAELGFSGEHATELLQGYMTKRMEAFLKSHGRSIIGWDEILDGEISSSATIMSWRGVEGGIEASMAGHDVIMCPLTHCYLDYYQSRCIQNEPFAIGGFVDVRKVYSFEPITTEMTPGQQKHILGVQANLWTEYIKTPEHLEYMLLPRMSALSEVQWCSIENRNYDRFLDKMTRMSEIYRKLGYNYATHIFEVQAAVGVNPENGCPQVSLSTQGDAPMYYTLDGSEPTVFSELYKRPVTVASGQVFKAIVDRDDIRTKVFTQTFSTHKAMGKRIVMNTEPSAFHSTGLPYSLVNGVLNENGNVASGEWMAWRGEPVEVVLDMSGETYSRVSVRILVSKWEDMYAPSGMSVYVSENNVNFVHLTSETYEMEGETIPDGVKLYDVEFPQTSAKYLKVVIETVSALPEWSERAGRPAYLFLDEIKVE